MAGPFTWWPNRKSAIGLRNCSKRPYSHSRVFVTTPPIAENPMLDLNTLGVDEKEVLRSHVAHLESELRKAAARESDVREDMKLLLATTEELSKHADERLAEARVIVEKAKTEYEKMRATVIAAQKEADPDTIALKVMYGVDERTEHHAREKAELRGIIAAKDSEIAELKRSKRRLREALDRLSKET